MRHHFIIGTVFMILLITLSGCGHTVATPPVISRPPPPASPALAAARQAKQAQINGIKQMARLREQIRARIQNKH